MMKNELNNFKVDFIGIGSAKCATTWVYKRLLDHPEICGPYKKELGFFLTKDSSLGDSIDDYHSITNSGIESYEKYFVHCKSGLKKGEFSVEYMNDPGSARAIYGVFPDVKIIACLDDPVKRAYSLYWYLKNYMNREKSATFEDAIKNNHRVYIENGKYYEKLKIFFEIFPRENIKILFVEDMKSDPINFMKSLYNFLGVDENFVSKDIDKKENLSKKVRFPFLRKLINMVPDISRFLKRRKLYFIVDFLRKIGLENIVIHIDGNLNARNFTKPNIKKKTEDELRLIFKKDIENLENLLKVDLGSWKI